MTYTYDWSLLCRLTQVSFENNEIRIHFPLNYGSFPRSYVLGAPL